MQNAVCSLIGRRPAGTVLAVVATAWAAALAAPAEAAQGTLPNQSYPTDLAFKIISPQMETAHHNQPHALNGYLLLAGNGNFGFWDISDPFAPRHVSSFFSPHRFGEAESHTLSFRRLADGTIEAVTISGLGVDFWDLSDAAAPRLLSSLLLEGISYGDVTNAVWGVFWDGRWVYVGGTNTGLHIVDAADASAPSLVARLPATAYGDFSAGPVFALGNLLVVTTPKNSAGVATMDVGDPAAPVLLDFVKPAGASYIGWVYGRHAHLITPFRTYDVTTDPANIALVGSAETPASEYMSFADGLLFLGALRPRPGVFKIDFSDPNDLVYLGKVDGRIAINIDDQFSVPIGNLLAISDDQANYGSVLAVHDTRRDTTPPTVAYVNPPDGAALQPTTTRVGVSFTDQIDLTTVDASSFVVRPVGGAPVPGAWGHMFTFATFAPDAPLAPNTTYEVILPAGGIADLVGNPLAATFRSVFSTGAAVDALGCAIAPLAPTTPGETATFDAADEGAGAAYRWEFGDGAQTAFAPTPAAAHAYAAPGRHAVELTVERDGRTARCTAVQIVHRPLAPGAPTRSSSVALDEGRGLVWVANPDADTVAAVDMTDLTKRFEVPVGTDPRTVALAPDGTLWVANHDSHDVTILDGEDGAFVDALALPHASAPHGVAMSPDGTRAYVTLEATGTLVAFDPAARTEVGRVEFGPDPAGQVATVRGIAVTADSARVLVTRFVSPEGQGEVYEVDAATLTATRTIALAPDPGPDTKDSGRGIPNYLSTIAIGPDGARAWVPSKKDNTARGLFRDGEALNPDNTVRTIVSSIDLGAGAEVLAERVDLNDHDMAYAAEPSPLGDLVFVAVQGTNQVDVLDAYAGTLVGGFATGLAPQGLALAGDGRLFVQNFLSRTLSVFDAADLLAGRDATAPLVAEVSTVAHEKLPAQVLRGKQIFYNADSRRMNTQGYISCASCHLDGGHDGRTWDFTDRGEGLRNTIELRGRAGTAHGPVHWTGNFDEIQDFENDIRGAFGGTGLMTDADFHDGTRSDPLGDPKKGRSADLEALAAYVASLDRVAPSPWRNPDGTMTAQARAGLAIFERLDCATCHAGGGLTDSALDVRHDVGTIGPGSGLRRGGPLDGFDTPTLRGLWATAPYLHDGSAATLRDVIDNPLHGNAAGLTSEEKDALVAYLLQLDDSETTRRLEAEDAALAGGVRVAADHANYSGAGYADFPSATGEDVRVSWTFTVVPGLGLHHLKFRYANGSLLPRALELRVNGEVVADSVLFLPTGGWYKWRWATAPFVDLGPGAKTVELVALGGRGPNVDFLEVLPAPAPACGLGPELAVLVPLLAGARALARRKRAPG